MLVRTITDDEIRTQRDEGFVYQRGLCDPSFVDNLRSAAQKCMAVDPSDLTMAIAREKGTDGRFFVDAFDLSPCVSSRFE